MQYVRNVMYITGFAIRLYTYIGPSAYNAAMFLPGEKVLTCLKGRVFELAETAGIAILYVALTREYI